MAWLNTQNPTQLYISAISKAEIELGLALMPSGQRQQALAKAAQAMFDEDFADQCLVFDAVAASALANAIPLVTRNTADFEQIEGLQVINPWDKSQKEVSSEN